MEGSLFVIILHQLLEDKGICGLVCSYIHLVHEES